ncbi:MAG TPA: outer membrane protein assembly factor BamA [Sphingomicrobium sp.]|nr:outer membrane protein assembly factor BamA [Sphingomicrobium sp.]
MTSEKSKIAKRAGALLLVGTILGGLSAPALSQDTVAPQPQPQLAAPAQAAGIVRSVAVRGNERLEPETVRSYANLQPGQSYTAESLDHALRELYATELFADVVITGAETGNLVITVRENPVINRILIEGNRRIKDDKILPEIRLAPRQIFTRSKVRADVERIIELYRRQGRFAARVEPKVVQLDQNRVDLVFEVFEGDRSKVRQINILGNEAFSDDRLRKEMFTRQAGGFLGFLRGNDSYDPDRLAADQQKLRAFYLTEGYADFRVVSALAELTPDRRDFIITYVIEEGPRYRFGTIEAESALRDMTAEQIKAAVRLQPGSWFNAKAVEDSVNTLNEMAGNLGYAFADINPAFDRDPENRLMNIILRVQETPRVYVERIEIQGNTATRDKVIRREFRLNEGDAFNAIKVRRSQDRLQSLGFFQDRLEIKQAEGSAPDRITLGVDVEERSTGELQFSAGYSSLERFILALSVAQRNFMGKGQELNAGINYSRYSRSVQLGFVEPYLFDRQVLLGGEIYRRDFNSFNFIGNERNRTYSQISTGAGLRLGFPVTEFTSVGTRYSLQVNEVSLDQAQFYTDPDGDGPLPAQCDPLKAGRYLCDEIGTRTTSSIGYSFLFNNTNAIRPTRGHRFVLSQDFAGLGGSVRYIRTRADGTKYWGLGRDFVLSAHAEGGYIHPLQASPGPGRDAIRLTDRFFGPQMRGFDIRGIGPRIQRIPYDAEGELLVDDARISDALGGRAYYMGRVELELPTTSQLRTLGLRPSVYVDAGSVWALKRPLLTNIVGVCVPMGDTSGGPIYLDPGEDCPENGYQRTGGYKEEFLGNSPSPRLSVGIGVNWTSPFGPLRLDLAKAILKQRGDDTKLFTFNVGAGF